MNKLIFLASTFFISGCGGWMEERKFQTFLDNIDSSARQIRWMDEDPTYFLEGQIADLPLPRVSGVFCVLIIASVNSASQNRVLSLNVYYRDDTLARGSWRWPNAFAVLVVPERPVYAGILVTSVRGQGRVQMSAYRVQPRVCNLY